jgi:hypothetical protein
MRNPNTVTASEIAEFVYCQEAWRLAQLGHKSSNQSAQVAGTDHHSAKATAERVAGGSIALGRILIIVALLVLAAWALTR